MICTVQALDSTRSERDGQAQRPFILGRGPKGLRGHRRRRPQHDAVAARLGHANPGDDRISVDLCLRLRAVDENAAISREPLDDLDQKRNADCVQTNTEACPGPENIVRSGPSESLKSGVFGLVPARVSPVGRRKQGCSGYARADSPYSSCKGVVQLRPGKDERRATDELKAELRSEIAEREFGIRRHMAIARREIP